MLRDVPRPHWDADDAISMNGALGQQDQGHDSRAETYEDPLDDVFGSAPNSPVLSGDEGEDEGASTRPDDQGPSDINRLRSTHVTNGYREGIAVGKEKHMQEGFDEGYHLGAEIGLKAGRCLGALDGIWRALPSVESVGSTKKQCAIGGVDVRHMLEEAEEELKLERLFGRDYFGEDGIWQYHVPDSQDRADDTTFEKIADAHPLVAKWSTAVKELAGNFDLELSWEISS